MLFLWKVPALPVLFLTNFIFGLASSFFAPFSSIFGLDEVGMSNIQFGVFMTIMSVSGVAFSTYIGKLSDRNVSRKRLLVAASIAAIFGFTGFALIRDYYILMLIAIFLLGVASAAVPQLWAYGREMLTHSHVPEREAPYVMNVFRAFFALSWTVGPAVAAWILLALGFRGLFLFVAVSYLLALICVQFLLKPVVPARKGLQASVQLRKFIFIPHIFANIMAVLLLTTATTINMLNIPQFVTKVLGGTEMHVGVIFSVPPVFEVPFMIGIGMLATRWNNGFLIRLGFLTAVVYFCLLAFVTEPWQIYPLQILSAAQVSITSGIAVTYFQNFIPEEPGTATTLYMNTTQIGSTLGFLLFGFVSQYVSYSSISLVCLLASGVGLLILLAGGTEKKKTDVAVS